MKGPINGHALVWIFSQQRLYERNCFRGKACRVMDIMLFCIADIGHGLFFAQMVEGSFPYQDFVH